MAARQCDEVQAEVETPRGKLTLRRRIAGAQEPIELYFGDIAAAFDSSVEKWRRFQMRRIEGRESFSQVMFRSLTIPEAPSDGASNVTMHQLLRLCYSDQQTPAARLFRFETFDTQNMREAVGDLICGVGGYEIFELGIELRALRDELEKVEARLRSLRDALPVDQAFDTPSLIQSTIEQLSSESSELQEQLVNVDTLIEPNEVSDYLADRQKAQDKLIKLKQNLRNLEEKAKTIEFELREVKEFVLLLGELREKVTFAEATLETVGSIEFTNCPACGQELISPIPENRCIVCKSSLDSEWERSKYNRIRLDLEIQMRESEHLVNQKEIQLKLDRTELRNVRREHKKHLSSYNLEYSSGNGPRDAFMAKRIKRLGHIEAEIDFLNNSLEFAEKIEVTLANKKEIETKIDKLQSRLNVVRQQAEARRPTIKSRISELGVQILRADLPRQVEFIKATDLLLNFVNDSISVGGLVNFAESSNVILKNSALFALFLAACADNQFNHPRFLLIDNMEDKGMEVERSHVFQRIVVDHATESKLPYQLIFTTSMMNPELDVEDYTIGHAYTSANRSLALV